jgi:hypothetical protein
MGETHGDREHIVDEHFLSKYRQLLDAEDSAFDELEHAYEDGDRAHFEVDFSQWTAAVNRRLSYLERHGYAPAVAAV